MDAGDTSGEGYSENPSDKEHLHSKFPVFSPSVFILIEGQTVDGLVIVSYLLGPVLLLLMKYVKLK
jgi:hypothetical protein